MVVTTMRSPTIASAQTTMRASGALVLLVGLIAALALIAAGVGAFWAQGDGPISAISIRGQSVQLYGRGIYRLDTLLIGAGNRGTDSVTLLLGIPLLIVCTTLYRRGSLRGGLLLIGTLFAFCYNFLSVAIGAAYNGLFLLYIALFSASLFAFVLAFSAVDPRRLAEQIGEHMPRRRVASFMIASGIVTTIVWLGPLLGGIVAGVAPKNLGTYTTVITDVLDLGIITPGTIIAGVLLLRRNALGYVVTFALIVLELMMAPIISAQTIFQLQAGVAFTPGEIIGPISGFIVLALVGIWTLVALLRNIVE